MSYYYQYTFTSPAQILAEIKEEMDSYFSTGVVDDVMFYTYVDKALRRLGRTTLKIDEVPLELKNYQAVLPHDFQFVRELWVCTDVIKSYPNPAYKYEAKTCQIYSGEYDPCNPCDNCIPQCVDKKTIVFKTTGETVMSFSLHALLTPGNISVREHCSHDCKNFGASTDWSFDIRDGKIITNICDGHLFLVYYKIERDEDDFQMIPDNFRILEYVKSFVKYKLYERIWNSVTDETANQIERKFYHYKQEADEGYITASIETKRPTTQQNMMRIQAQRRRFKNYRLR